MSRNQERLDLINEFGADTIFKFVQNDPKERYREWLERKLIEERKKEN